MTQQPVSDTVEEGQTAVFESAASGSPTPTVQWQTSVNNGSTWTAVAGATSDKLTLAGEKITNSGRLYRAAFKNVVATVDSQAAALTVHKAPAISKQPAGATVEAGQGVTFEAEAAGFPEPTVQWELSVGGGSWSPIEGAISTQLKIASAQIAEDGNRYRAVFTNVAGTVTSEPATLSVVARPNVTDQPSSTTVEVGEGASFEATASGYPTPAVQWELSTNGGGTWSQITGATSNQLSIAATSESENGHQFRAVFTNTAGSTTSAAAMLTVATNHFSAVAWGQNVYRQLGNGSAESLSDVPGPVTGLKFVTAVAAGGRHSLALLANGSVVGWGYNAFGQLGDESTGAASVPVAVKDLSGVKAIAAGGDHSLALLGNGTLMAWGDDESGQLGNGKTSEEPVELPVAVKGLTGVKAIAAGAGDSLALLNNGTVWAWGEGEAGELGNGTVKQSHHSRPGQRADRREGDRGRGRIRPGRAVQRDRRGMGQQRIRPTRRRRSRRNERRAGAGQLLERGHRRRGRSRPRPGAARGRDGDGVGRRRERPTRERDDRQERRAPGRRQRSESVSARSRRVARTARRCSARGR